MLLEQEAGVIPTPKTIQRKVNQALEAECLLLGLDKLSARVLSSRLDDKIPLKTWLESPISALTSPKGMAGLPEASIRLMGAIKNGETIGIETDHDCDGQTSHAVLFLSLTQYFQYPKEKVRSYIGHRLQEGYGLSKPLVDRILQDETRPTLLITADNGSSDEEGIARLKAEGIDVIVTDHHAIPMEGIPKSAYAVLNPTRNDCEYNDPYIAGCMVAWLFMAYVRTQLIQNKIIKDIPSLAGLLDFVAVGTVADCVSLSKSINNRIVIRYGLNLISQFKRPCWRALKDELSVPVSSEDLGFKVGPLLNSDGRLSCAFGSVSFLLSEEDEEARVWVSHLADTNLERKAIQKRLTEDALKRALLVNREHTKSLCVYLPEGHAGVHGITASRIKDLFGKPTFVFSPKQSEENELSGSGRSIDACHLRQALQYVSDHYPHLMARFGGHRGAAGVTLNKKHFDAFAKAFEEAVRIQISEILKPEIFTDGVLPVGCFTVESIRKMNQNLEPFGREFETPQFEMVGFPVETQWIGGTKLHLRFTLLADNQSFPCLWFNARHSELDPMPFEEGERIKVVYAIQIDTFRGNPSLKCFVRHASCVSYDCES